MRGLAMAGWIERRKDGWYLTELGKIRWARYLGAH